mmetsp:Transcript_51095/g.119627  ORF Transcript_51095/g.119627 Transcript_51095/m.119627 type:complete len:397 (-) Transcript_51095:4-1194(-)
MSDEETAAEVPADVINETPNSTGDAEVAAADVVVEAAAADTTASTEGQSPSGAAACPSVEQVQQLRSIVEEAPQRDKQEVLDALNTLRSFGSLPAKMVKDTGIGLVVNTCAKNPDLDADIAKRAKELLVEWRDAHRKKRQASSASLQEGTPLKRLNSTASETGLGLSQRTTSQLSQESAAASDRQDADQESAAQPDQQDAASQEQAPLAPMGDSKKTADLREKVRQKLAEALSKEEQEIESKDEKDGNEEQRDPVVLAKELEEALYTQLLKAKGEKEYNNQARAVIWNMKDKKNHTFRFKLSVGFFRPEQVPTLTAEEMASDEKNAERTKIRQDAAEAIQSDWGIRHGATRISGMFTCGKCKGTRTTYFQMQTRSSDEPMTTFVTCLGCGNRWKFC